ncbi:PadR family transcriptional regulator [Trichococcus pasteurii]|uniref:Transcription regulator padr n-terminal n=1 Tax=Trichococcus pasteurii TaxID=43064 RepID=A0A1W1IF41_9LACT|nr:PadR family transcriptional regulator [Trichococcus pasteurii]SFE44540.1 Transcriptional regulator PadR-like family protein [Trichococcus pasteurii]SLM51638.1 transcription regulator padr n-terminal [Trichococcus pasteurii]SSB92519.1 transcription regulator padr n-terminal [Trichococcus pasteurii]
MGAPLTESMFYILLSLLQPNHGYGIMQQVEERTKGRVALGAGTLYGALNTLLEKKWITLHSQDDTSRKKKEYLITALGKEVLNEEIARLGELFENGRKAMENDKKI